MAGLFIIEIVRLFAARKAGLLVEKKAAEADPLNGSLFRERIELDEFCRGLGKS
ncbi:MAG: hypothetical protein V1754_08405 [Pseudomonadota bacterium]